MSISLNLFLDILLLLLILFPSATMYLNKKSVSEFGKAFFSSFSFITVYLFFTVDNILSIFKFKFEYSILLSIFFIVLCSLLSLGIEFIIAKIKFKEIKVMNITAKNIFVYFMVLIFIPIIEEICFIGYLSIICERLQLGAIFFIILSGFSFGINHIIYSKFNILTKTIWGITYALCYYLTGNIYIVILSHILNNVILFYLGKRNKQ